MFPGIVTRDQIAELNNIADLFLLPSYNELFPMSVLEAFSCGTPVMLRDLDLYHSIIGGYYQPAKDVNQMQAELVRIAQDPVALADLKQKSLTAAQRYSKDHLANEWYHVLFERKRGGNRIIRGKNWVVLILMLVAGAGIFAFSLRNTDLHQLSIDLANLNWGWFSVAVLCICLYTGACKGSLLKLFMADRYPDFSWKNTMRVPLVEQTLQRDYFPFPPGAGTPPN